MKQKILSLLLALSCCLSLTAPVFAADWKTELPDDLSDLIGEITRGEEGRSITVNPGVPYIPSSSWHASAESSAVPAEPQKADMNLKNFKKVNTYRPGMFTDMTDQDWFAKNEKSA